MDTLAVNGAGTAVCVAGRNVFKVFSCVDGVLAEVHNLREGIGRNATLLWVARDVAWSPLLDTKIATASTNGCVVLWDLERPHKNKQEAKFRLHERTVNKVAFNPQSAHQVLSGSSDGCVRLLDMRTNGDDALSFDCGTDEVQFNTGTSTLFAAAYEAGDFKLWDVRRADRAVHKEQAHAGPILSMHFHPSESALLATAGRDRIIRVWSLHSTTNTHINYINNNQPTVDPMPLYSVQTAQPVHTVRWRASHEWQLASSSLVLDHSVNVWDVRRPFIPTACFTQHTDVVTGMAWANGEQLLTCGKDGAIFINDIAGAHRPIEHVNPNALAVSVRGEIAIALPRERRARSTADDYKFGAPVTSQLFACVPDVESIYVQRANEYMTTEDTLLAVCAHNARVCEAQNDVTCAHFWTMLPIACADAAPLPSLVDTRTNSHESTTTTGQTSKENDAPPPLVARKSSMMVATGMTSTPGNVTATAQHPHDFYFGMSEMLTSSGADERPDTDDAYSDGGESDDAFSTSPPKQPTRAIVDSDEPPVDNRLTPPSIDDDNDLVMLPSAATDTTPPDVRRLIGEQLTYMVETQADVQTAVTALLVLANVGGAPLIDDVTQERWFMAYIDMLDRYSLHTRVGHIIKTCTLTAVRELTSTNTSLRVCCGNCKRVLVNRAATSRATTVCDKCACETSACVVCQLPVRGRYVWCRGCSHGGHTKHIHEWFSTHDHCPSGCGHACYDGGIGATTANSRHTSGQPPSIGDKAIVNCT